LGGGFLDSFLVDELISILDKEAALYEDVLKLSKNKTNIIVEGKVSELESIVKLEQSMIFKMAKLEDVREGLVEKLSKQLGVNSNELTITQLSNMLQKEQAGKLNVCHKGLAKVLAELKDSNGLNSKLIKNSLEYIDFSVNLLASTSIAGNLYGNSGQTNDSSKRNFFDVKL
jgi:hypothetical protein